jgi:hypothetical protein
MRVVAAHRAEEATMPLKFSSARQASTRRYARAHGRPSFAPALAFTLVLAVVLALVFALLAWFR